jgi:hypothetical protein
VSRLDSVGCSYRKHVSWKCRYPSTRLHGVKIQKTITEQYPPLEACEHVITVRNIALTLNLGAFKLKVGGSVFFREDGNHLLRYMLSEPRREKYKFHCYENLKSRTG